MPRSKRWKQKRQRAATMGQNNSKKCRTLTNEVVTDNIVQATVSPDVEDKKNDDNELTRQPTGMKSTLRRELCNLTTQNRLDERYQTKDNGNRLIHWDSLSLLVCSNVCCKNCGSEVSLTETTTGIATEVKLKCKNRNCKLDQKNKLRKCNYKNYRSRQGSSESFCINLQFVLGLMQVGAGAAESGTLLTFLDMAHANTFHRNTFRRVQNFLRQEIKVVSNGSMKTCREEEISKTVSKEIFEQYKDNKTKPSDIPLTCSYDMGWNKRSSGRKYDSISGHGFVIGTQTKKIINFRCMSKCCIRCTKAEKNNVPVEAHECPRNHAGSSKSMETEAIFRMVKEATYSHGYHIFTIISDDDSTMKSNLKHSYKELVSKKK